MHNRFALAPAVLACLPILQALSATAQPRDADTLSIEVRSDGRPVSRATVRVSGEQRTTDAAGRASLPLAPGEYEVTVEAAGYLPASAGAVVTPGAVAQVTVELEALQEQVTVFSARSATRLQDQPLRVEVIDREEIEEKALMTPGSVAMLLGETTGVLRPRQHLHAQGRTVS